jgi:hypothetical protein
MIGLRAITRRRYGAQTNVGGHQTLGAYTDTTIRASVYPATGKDLEALPEGERTRSVQIAECLSEILTSEPSALTSSDRLIISGVTYLARQVQDWPRVGSIPRHWRTVCVRLQEAE